MRRLLIRFCWVCGSRRWIGGAGGGGSRGFFSLFQSLKIKASYLVNWFLLWGSEGDMRCSLSHFLSGVLSIGNIFTWDLGVSAESGSSRAPSRRCWAGFFQARIVCKKWDEGAQREGWEGGMGTRCRGRAL